MNVTGNITMSETSMDLRSKISTTVDFDADGVQHGNLLIPNSRNDSPWGSLLMPLSVFKNGKGPTVLFTGGNHGDEYEGPIALMKLAQTLDINKISGRVIVIPALNYPAVKAGARLSPLDGKNMNRSFPGDRDGTITDMIADFVQRFILPIADVVIDIHAGGKMMRFLPTTVIHKLPDKNHMDRTIAAAKAFGAPNCLVLEELDAAGMLDTAVEQLGKVFVSTELGGGGTTTVETMKIATDGVNDILIHYGILAGDPKGSGETRFLETPDDAFVIASAPGVIEFITEPGHIVRKGDVIANIHDIDMPSASPTVYCAAIDGIIVHRHDAGLIGRGDCLSVIAVDVDIDIN
jgi:N-alpha-acetyl-L-2,4-diaminobutyrate deacetylase